MTRTEQTRDENGTHAGRMWRGLNLLVLKTTDAVSPTCLVSCDPTAPSFACVNSATGVVRIYAMKKLGTGPMITWTPHPDVLGSGKGAGNRVVNVSYSPNGRILLLTTNTDRVVGFEADTGKFLFKQKCVSTIENPAVPSWSANAKFVSAPGLYGPNVFKADFDELSRAIYPSVSLPFAHDLNVGADCDVARISCWSPRTELLVTSGKDGTVFWNAAQQ